MEYSTEHLFFFAVLERERLGFYILSEQMPYNEEDKRFKIHVPNMNEPRPDIAIVEDRANIPPVKKKIRVLDPFSTEIQVVEYWYTPYKVYSTILDWVRVIDFSDRSCIPDAYRYKIMGDTAQKCMERETQIQMLRNSFMCARTVLTLRAPTPPRARPRAPTPPRARARAPTPPRAPVPAPTKAQPKPQLTPNMQATTIPTFVAEALKRDAISKGDTCPISMNPFTASTRVTILSCFHIFTEESILEWTKRKNECPSCKAKIQGIVTV